MSGITLKDLDISDSETNAATLIKEWTRHPFHSGTTLQKEFVEFIARKAVETTITKVYLDILKENEDTEEQSEIEKEWMSVIYNIKENNNLEQWCRGVVRQCSIYGKSYVYFDIDEFGNIYLSTYIPHWLNHTTKYKQNKEFVSTGVRQLFKSKFYFGSYVAEQRTFNENVLFPILNNNTTTIPNWIFNFDVPETIKKELEFGVYETNYQFLSVKEILNKNRIDFKFNDFEMCDTYTAWQYFKTLDILKTFIDDEPKLNHSMQFGTFDYTTLANKIIGKPLSNQLGDVIARTPNTPENTTSLLDLIQARKKVSEDPFIAKKFMNLRGQNPQIQILQSNFDGNIHFNALDKLYDFLANLSGYTFSFQNQQASRTSAGVETLSKRDFETTRDKINLLQSQLMEFFQRLFGAYFRLKYQSEIVGMKAYEITPKMIDFRIVSSLVNEYLNKDEMNIAKAKANLISQEQAIQNANINLPDTKVEIITKELAKQKQEQDKIEKENKEQGIGLDKNIQQVAGE